MRRRSMEGFFLGKRFPSPPKWRAWWVALPLPDFFIFSAHRWFLGDAWRAPKAGRCRVRVWGGVSPLSRPGGSLGSVLRSWAAPAGSEAEPGRKRILTYFEGQGMCLFVPLCQNLLWRTICISVALQILGDWTCLPPWSRPMLTTVLSVHPSHSWSTSN